MRDAEVEEKGCEKSALPADFSWLESRARGEGDEGLGAREGEGVVEFGVVGGKVCGVSGCVREVRAGQVGSGGKVVLRWEIGG